MKGLFLFSSSALWSEFSPHFSFLVTDPCNSEGEREGFDEPGLYKVLYPKYALV